MSNQDNIEKQEPVGIQSEPKNKIIFMASLDDKKDIKIDIFTKHTPSLAFAFKLLSIEIDKMIITQAIEKAREANLIVKPKHKIFNFVRGLGR